MRKFLLVLAVVLIGLFFPGRLLGEPRNQFITIVNPVRVSTYTKDSKGAVSSEYQIVFQNKLSATWLLTFDAIEEPGIYSVVSGMNKNQELGIFLEVTPNFAKQAGVTYHDTGFWYHATSVFLSGYTQDERIRLIDTVFNKFKERFGYYPTSVGSWWTDSFSLEYMQKKYGVTANLICADQFLTDGYQIWGQPWSVPFYPSKYHTGISAPDESVKLDVVNIQWAPRDPINGYKSSMYSTQDYSVIKLDFDYFKKLVDLYAKRNLNDFGQITIGLEGDLDAAAYNGEFKKQIEYAKSLQDGGDFEVLNMASFSNWYRNKFPKFAPPMVINSSDQFGEDKKVVWYESPRYRIGVLFDREGNNAKIFDFRTYHKDMMEPYYVSPNRQFNLSVYVPSYFDEISNPEDVWSTNLSEKDFHFFDDKIVIDKFYWFVPKVLAQSPALTIKRSIGKTEIIPKEDGLSPLGGVVIKDYRSEAIHFFRQKRAILDLLMGVGWNYFKKVSYLIPQGEIDALYRLSVLSAGKVMVFDNECLQCSWHTEFKPLAFSNLRGYVAKFGRRPIVYNSSVFSAKTREEAKKDFDKLHVKYVYLVKFEDYVEKLPFSPGDLGVEKIYSNANAEIWKVKQ